MEGFNKISEKSIDSKNTQILQSKNPINPNSGKY